jgi:hypothetical protein
MPWYRSGTVSVAQNSNAVIGTGSSFLANARVGDAFRGPDGGWYEVINIASDTSMAIAPNYQGATNADGVYALAPMQGYVKESADALRSLVNQFGTKLAALGTTGNYEILPLNKGGTGGTTQAEARTSLGLGSVSIESTVPVNKGGTGGTDQATARTGLGLGSVATESTVPISKGGTGATTAALARAALQLKNASLADILGTVSQAAGIPTGAIIEKGSNSSGEYVRYADGTQICWYSGQGLTASTGAVGNLFGSTVNTWNYPISFATGSEPVFMGACNSGPSWLVPSGPPNSISASWQRLTSYSDGTGRASRFFAIGRWY